MLGVPFRLVVNLLANLVAAFRLVLRRLRRPADFVVVELRGNVPERPSRRGLFRRREKPSIETIAHLFDEVAADRRVKGVVLKLRDLEIGWARLESLRALVAGLRARGRRVVAHLSGGGNLEVALACAADAVFVDESAPLPLSGLRAETTFLRDALDRLGVRAEICAIGEYKSAAEPLLRTDMSPPSREAATAIVDALCERAIGFVAEGRRLEPARARAALFGGPYTAAGAVAAGLCDAVLYEDEIAERLGEAGRPARLASQARYERLRAIRLRWRPLLRQPRQIAVLSVEGLIASGEGAGLLRRVAAADPIRRALGWARASRHVAGVVLHVDSRGGAADASDRIWRDVVRLAREKPVVAHLGDVAASGGYYVVAPCARIVARPMTLTGSIGVVGGKIVLEGLLERLGIGRELLARGEAAAMTSPMHGYSREERRRLEAEVRAIYDQFVAKVAEGRKLAPEVIEKVARGRVWTGAEACARGLVDELGGLREAVARCEEAARRRPGERFRIVDVRPEPRGGGLLRRFFGAGEGSLRAVGELWEAGELGLLARARALLVMPFSLRVR